MKSKKIILSSLIFILILCLFSATVYADEITTLVSDMKSQNIHLGDGSGTQIIASINSILGIVQIAGTGVALIAVSLLGIKYMLASAEDKAEIKKYIAGAVIGGILVFGGTGIAKVLATFTNDVFSGGAESG